jgi:ribosomal protein L11 methyltransferase
VLNAAFPSILSAMADDGVVFISGILKSQAEECLEVGRRAGLVFDQVITKSKWVTARGHKAR